LISSFMVGCYTLDSITPAIHRSAWNRNSQKFALKDFYEVQVRE
jgi:hypothetical protein